MAKGASERGVNPGKSDRVTQGQFRASRESGAQGPTERKSAGLAGRAGEETAKQVSPGIQKAEMLTGNVKQGVKS